MRRACSRCLSQAGRALETGPAPARLVVRPFTTAMPSLASDRPPTRRSQMAAGAPASMYRPPKASITVQKNNAPISEPKVDYPVLPNEKYLESWTVRLDSLLAQPEADDRPLAYRRSSLEDCYLLSRTLKRQHLPSEHSC